MENQPNKWKAFVGSHKRAVFLAVGIVAVAGAAAAFFLLKGKGAPQDAASYREYTAAKEDVTVGVSESGTVSLTNKSISFPVDSKISSILVKAGTNVKKGDPLIQLDVDSVRNGSSETRQKLESAKLSLQQALNDQKAKLETAKITYEASRSLAESAPATRQLTEQQLQNEISSAQAALTKDQKQLSDYQALLKSYPSDYEKLQDMEKWMNDAQSSKTSYENQLEQFNTNNKSVIDRYNSLEDAVNDAETEWVKAKYTYESDADIADLRDAYNEAKDVADSYYENTAGTVLTRQKDLENKVAQYTAEYNNYTTAYNNFKETFSDRYQSGDSKLSSDTLSDKVSELEATVKTDQFNLQKAQKTAEISSVDAKTKEKTDLSEAENAQDTYDLTVTQLYQAVDTQQETYDTLQTELDNINSAMNGSGVLVSPCDGVVATVSSSDGASVKADTEMMAVSETGSVSLAVSVSEDDITNVSIGQEASVTLSSYDDETFDALVESITAEPARSGSSSVSYTVTVRLTAANTGTEKIYTGMSGEATLIQKREKDALSIPNRAVSFQNGVSTVLVKTSSGGQEKRTIVTGFSNGTNVAVTSGLQEGDTVLAESGVTAK